MQNSIGERVIFAREHFGLNQGELSEEVGMAQSGVSRIEANIREPSPRFLNALMVRFAVSPDWIMTGEGSMLIPSEEYIAKGIELLGAKEMGEGFLKLLQDPRFPEFRSCIALDDVTREFVSDELRDLLQRVIRLWGRGDETINRTLAQVVKTLSEVGEEGKR
jgi:transcriptional regulator with XRE-family HTH domain